MTKQQIILSGTGGQGILFLTRLLAEAAMAMNQPVLTSETHGMAMRGGTVISHVKVGPFMSPLISRGRADTGLFLNESNLAFHADFVKPDGQIVVNATTPGVYLRIDATGCAKEIGSLLAANLVLLGFAVERETLFCDSSVMKAMVKKFSNPRHRDMNVVGFEQGLNLGGGV
jgi:indolepyruvate ferredoxin oxidoreductase beta subunit